MQEYNFEILEISCGTTKELINVSRVGAWLVIEGALNIPDPCHALKFFPEYDAGNKVLRIYIKAYKLKVFCMKCLAKAKFRMKFNTIYLRDKFSVNKINIHVKYYVKGKTAEFVNEGVEI